MLKMAWELLVANWSWLSWLISAGVLWAMLSLLFSRPKIVFGDAHLGNLTWHIPVCNMRRYGWLGYFFRRSEAIECRVRIEYTANGKLLYRFAEPWADSPIGKTLPANSEPFYFPLASLSGIAGRINDVSLDGTPLRTDSSLPPYKLSERMQVIANVEVTSREKLVAKSQWVIDIDTPSFTPLNVRRSDTL